MSTESLPLVCKGSNKRPTKTEEMRRQAALELVAKMSKSGALTADDDLEECADDIVEATQWGIGDGYEIARDLENRFHWTCCMQLAKELDQFGTILGRIYDAAEDVWAAENPREPEFASGAIVTWCGKPATIHGVYEYRPQRYRVRTDDMTSPTSYYVVPFEDVSARDVA